jgi:hypothetical protein
MSHFHYYWPLPIATSYGWFTPLRFSYTPLIITASQPLRWLSDTPLIISCRRRHIIIFAMAITLILRRYFRRHC